MRYLNFYQQYISAFPEPDDRGECKVLCPFHDDTDASMAINVQNGLWHCFGRCDEGGDAYSFYQKVHQVSFREAKKEVDRIIGNKGEAVTPIDPELVNKYHTALLSAPEVLKFMKNERGIDESTIKTFKLGWDGSRVTMPVYDDRGFCMNMRRYKPHGRKQDKMINFKTGYGRARLYPLDVLMNHNTVILHEGEWDMLLSQQLGFMAMTNTGGSGTWSSSWTSLFTGKNVFICYDIDEAGRNGANMVASKLYNVANSVRIVALPITEPKNADFTDYIMKHGYTAHDFKELIMASKPWIPPKATNIKEYTDGDEVPEVTLAEARQARYRSRHVRMRVLVVGKDLAPYTIPRKVKFTCSAMSPDVKECSKCIVNANGGEAYLDVPPNSAMLNLIRCTEQQQQGFIRSWVGVPRKCDKCSQELLMPQNIEELLLAPEINYETSRLTDQYTLQRAFFIAGDSGAIRSNQSYKVEGLMVPDPWQQYVTFVLNSAIPMQDSISGFIIDETIRKSLKIFQVKEGQTVKEKFDDIHKQFSRCVTHIYGREDLLTAIDLVYHSALQFDFQGIPVTRGWLDALVIGDTRTGKSETTERMMAHFHLAEMVFGENTTFSGLVGGMQQTQSRWFITWGKIPLNDRRMVIIDEASGLTEDDFSRLSGIRSSGIAEITKIQTERAFARTRLLWLSNPRAGRAIKEYSYGVEAVSELIGKVEDVARFDFALSAASDEIPTELINAFLSEQESCELEYTQDLCKTLILWAWSRRSSDIVFEEEATKEILAQAIQMGKVYSTKIPLVEPANQRIKIARMAVAVAIRVYSTDEAGQKVYVKKEHVDFAVDYLNEIYSKASFAYKAYSRQEKDSERIAAEKSEAITAFVEANPGIATIFLQQHTVKTNDIIEILNIPRETANEYIHMLANSRMIEKLPYGYKKTSSFIALLRNWQNKATS